MFATGFESFAYQTVGYGSPLTPNGGARRDYVPTYYEIQNRKNKIEALRDSEHEAEIELLSVEYKIEEAELKRTRDLADQALQMELIALLQQQYILNEILRELRLKKEMLRREEDDIIILMMSMPFYG